jgi:ribosomal protein S18 acetylase RimI-like enzyme
VSAPASRTPGAPVDAWLEPMFEGLIGKNTYYPSQLGGTMRVHRDERHAVISSGFKTDTFNLVISQRLGAEAPAVIDRVCGEFNAAGLPAAWWTCDELREEAVAGLLQRHGFVEDEVDVGMVAELSQLPPLEYPAGLVLKQVETPEELVAFGQVIASLFEPPDPHVARFYEQVARLGRLAERPLKLFLALLDGRAVGTSSIFLSGEGAHIFDISTRAEHRNRGYGSAITHFSLLFARGLGARLGALQAAPDGLNIYRRMGFREVCTFRIYSNKRAIFGR